MGREVEGEKRVTGELGWSTMKARRDVSRLKFWWKLVNLAPGKLLRQVYATCKPILENERSSWFHGIRELLKELHLEHTWHSEVLGSRREWLVVVKRRIKLREKDLWVKGLQEKPKLRLFRVLKPKWGREDYVSLPMESRQLIAELRCGTNRLRVETGRWRRELLEHRICMLCGTRQVEDERHVLLNCPIYGKLRPGLWRNMDQDSGETLSSK